MNEGDCFLGAMASSSTTRLDGLRDLHRRRVNVGDKVINCLFSNSPFIEHLCAIDSQRLCELEVVDAPNLKYLEFCSCHGLQDLKNTAPNLNTIKLFTSDAAKIKFCHKK